MPSVAHVAVLRAVHSLYTYVIPSHLLDEVAIGTWVHVPFGTVLAPGVVFAIDHQHITSLPLKPIDTIDSKRPHLTLDQFQLIDWIRNHYLTTPFQAIQTVVGKQTIRPVEVQNISTESSTPHPASSAQREAIQAILSCEHYQDILLHGVTGSGKTEVYLQVTTQILMRGKSALVLVPEIALTPQISRLFSDRLGQNVVVVHSGLTKKQRSEAWNRIYNGASRVVIGPRSAVFSPILNLGVIIVDECHDGSYKQEQNPRYDALSVAKFRAKHANIPLVLGSATPTIEQLYTHKNNPKFHIKLPTRILNRPMPEVHLLDTRDHSLFPDDAIIGNPLIQAIKIATAKREKAMILVNRRGYAPTVSCQKCKNIVSCSECNLGYTYHSDRKLRCHRCFTIIPLPTGCPSCRKGNIAISGIAIQKVEIELRKYLPESHILRLDRDTGSTPQKISEIMDEFRNSGDVLIGTQMIAKGHDIADVTVVGIVGLDSSLGIPDFRACERTFQLICQVSGRAGRGEKPGEVYLQSAHPNHYAVVSAISNDTETFFNTEIGFRKSLHYPPFTELVNIIISGTNAQLVATFSRKLYQHSQKTLDPLAVTIMPVQPAPVPMIRNHVRWHILYKCIPGQSELIRRILQSAPVPPRGIRLIVDFDPQSIL
ncbi:primosomal protein N' [bacterium]|nr:primosomal protein N' [bacterium]